MYPQPLSFQDRDFEDIKTVSVEIGDANLSLHYEPLNNN